MKTEQEIREEINKHLEFTRTLDFQNDVFAGQAEADSLSWINALEWVLEDSLCQGKQTLKNPENN